MTRHYASGMRRRASMSDASRSGPPRVASLFDFSPDGNMIATASLDDTAIHLWNIATGEEKPFYPRHEGPIRSIAFSMDARTIVSAGDDCTIRLWDATTGKQVRRIR